VTGNAIAAGTSFSRTINIVSAEVEVQDDELRTSLPLPPLLTVFAIICGGICTLGSPALLMRPPATATAILRCCSTNQSNFSKLHIISEIALWIL
jgi:hypothetical protein